MESTNPLFSIQREKAGSQTFSKYKYQYHWALYRIMKEHEEEREYAVIVELHEDVVLANSLNKDNVTFEFNQVKTNSSNYTKNSIKKLNKGSSVLGKLIASTSCMSYSDRVTDVNLVATSGFNKDFLPIGITMESIGINEMPTNILESLSESITKELSISFFPINIHLVTPKLPVKGFQEFIVGEISRVVTKLYPNSFSQAINIYRPLIDELYRKGAMTDDFHDWDELLKQKALTSITVKNVINQFTENKDTDKMYQQLEAILSELDLKVMQKSKYEKSFRRYYLKRIGDKTIAQLDIARTIDTHISNCNEEIKTLIKLVEDSLPKKILDNFSDEIDIRAAIICEYILKEHN